MQVIFALTGDPHTFTLDRHRHLFELIAHHLAQLLRNLLTEALTQLHHLLHPVASDGFRCLKIENLEGEVAFGRFGSQHILHRLKRHITGRGDHQLRFLKIDLGAGILEVITVANITTNLIKGVHQLLTIKVRDHIEGISAGHVANLSILQFRNPSISSRVWPT